MTAGYLSGAALSFLLGEGDLAAEFDVRAQRCDPDSVALHLVPREEASYESLGLIVAAATGEVRETRVVDLFGNVTEVRFLAPRVNTSPPPATFEFVPPADATVIDLAP